MVNPAGSCGSIHRSYRYTGIILALLLTGGGVLMAEDAPYLSVAPLTGIPLGASAELYAFALGASLAPNFPHY